MEAKGEAKGEAIPFFHHAIIVLKRFNPIECKLSLCKKRSALQATRILCVQVRRRPIRDGFGAVLGCFLTCCPNIEANILFNEKDTGLNIIVRNLSELSLIPRY